MMFFWNTNIRISFDENHASQGRNLYGGLLDRFTVNVGVTNHSDLEAGDGIALLNEITNIGKLSLDTIR